MRVNKYIADVTTKGNVGYYRNCLESLANSEFYLAEKYFINTVACDVGFGILGHLS